MSFTNPAHRIARRSIAGGEGEWVKHFDPPKASPPTPERLNPTNPVPAFKAATVPGATQQIPNTVSLGLMHGLDIDMWDGRRVAFFLFSDDDVPATKGGTFPAATIRVPRGAIFHGHTESGGSPPHTVHWHGIEPTPMNDGVGHCSFEIGRYTYQFQPNYIGTYFYHCHRNTMQHFEFGLYGMLVIEPPDAFANPATSGGYPRRTAANLARFPQFPGFNNQPLTSGDPHAMTVPYDVEAAWVVDDRSSQWSDFMDNPKDTFPAHGNNPGVDDMFLKGDFHDYNPDYFFVTGLPFPAPLGGTGTCAPSFVVPPDLNSGVSGMQVPVNARVGQTVLVRFINAAYCPVTVSFPTDVVIIAFDGRALGVPPYGLYNNAFVLRAGHSYFLSTARRFDVLMRPTAPVSGHGIVQFRNHRNPKEVLFTGRIPVTIS